ncbi:N-acetylmuramoyl-L-alanine amidase [Sulfurifustis variabilis]|uniref:N-acetylmuramoyl-L-alanine amidase AmiC n=1 Tax=Sulfurifustis variabilis TaxID=1675686 RepID=A0A1B4V6H4_9GAMM|nr:N-acetylmuramoyl-L-alanine amidase [Sulfurifustis variabilis]BAU48172.1 N-acetylmuramoyl-L-alanine amidase [Sulfurifustis variabilis]
MNVPARVLGAVLLLLVFFAPAHAAVSVQNLRQWRAPDHTRLVLDVSGPVEHRLFTLSDPHRIVVDLEDAVLGGELPVLDASGPLLAALRTGRPDPGTLRIVLDLKTEARPRSFLLKPAGQYGHRLVIDLHDLKAEAVATASTAPDRRTARQAGPRNFVIAIDAGHGGEDPGAVGRRYRTFEKTVTLAVARELARRMAKDPTMRPVLIRDGDYYVGLSDRFKKARDHRADVFVSIHADAVPGRQASGSSVYALSEKGATDAMARFIADKENASDLIGGVSLNDKDDLLAKVLLDLSHTKTIHDSLSLGDDLLTELKRVGPVHHQRVRQAGFMVLKAPDIPSVLVEVAFISNPTEEKKLRTAGFQRRLAEGIYRGLKRFVARLPDEPSPAVAAARHHVVRPGETLASIARRYEVQAEVLRFANELSREPSAGTRLLIP